MLTVSFLYYMFNLGFVIIFATLSIFAFMIHLPTTVEYKNYRKSRYILGSAFTIMALYCVFRLIVPQLQHDFEQFWVLIFVSLIFSWLNYTSFLFLINTEHKIKRYFIIDGVAPITLIFILGMIGSFIPSVQGVMRNLLGLIFLLKCAWMFYIADREWRRVNKELKQVYDLSPDIRWIRQMVWLTFALSITCVVAWYFPSIHILFDVLAPLTYFYMTLKVLNYYPKKIDDMRGEGASLAVSQSQPQGPISRNLAALEPKIEEWVEAKKFCRANLTIKDVALEIGTNHSYLSKYLNSHLNSSFQVWLNTLRIEHSKTILASEKISIEEVGARVGIPQSYNFSRWFKIVTGETPFRYRHNLVRTDKL